MSQNTQTSNRFKIVKKTLNNLIHYNENQQQIINLNNIELPFYIEKHLKLISKKINK